MSDFEKVRNFLLELDFSPVSEDPKEEIFVIEREEQGIKNLVIDCENPILILEQYIFTLKDKSNADTLYKLLCMNRNMVHGAFVISDEGDKVLFRDTLQIENLDLNELEASINALSIAMAENSHEIIKFAQA